MAANLDLDQVCAGHPLALRDLAALRRIVELAAASVNDPGWGAFSDADDALEAALIEFGAVPGPELASQD